MAHRLNVYERIAGHCYLWASALLLLLVTSASFAAGYPKIGGGPDPQFFPLDEQPVTDKKVKPSTWGTYGGPRILPCPGTRATFGDECLTAVHRRAVREIMEVNRASE